MNRLNDLISHILTERIDEISHLIMNELLDDLIEHILNTWQENPEVCFEELREKVIEKLNQSIKG